MSAQDQLRPLDGSRFESQECPDLSGYYNLETAELAQQVDQLALLMSLCLRSSEYFALLGGAQLNGGRLPEAFESLERALLLDPDNGAAQVDYAQALFEEGQLFSALELNQRILARSDLPADLVGVLERRQQRWQAFTRQTDYHGDLLLGYDDNLNGAPDPDLITLTVAGESVLLPLNPEFQAQSGTYGNIRLGVDHRRLAPDSQQQWSGQIRGRLSEETESDLLQFDGRYSYIRPRRDNNWQLEAGLSNLLFGGSPLFTAAEFRARHSRTNSGRCQPYYDLVLQQQFYHEQSQLNAIDTRAGTGLSCGLSLAGNSVPLRINVGASLLNSQALKAARPGGDRQGWQVSADLQMPVGGGSLRALLNHNRLDDREAYSQLLINGGRREVSRSYALIQYRYPLQIRNFAGAWVMNFFHQDQHSNIELFESRDATLELGISLQF